MQPLHASSRFPKQIIHVFGNAIGVSGMVFTNKFISQSLTPLRQYGTSNSRTEVKNLAKIFVAVRKLNDAIGTYYCAGDAPDIPPYYPSVPNLPPLKYKEIVMDGPTTHLFKAEMNSENVLVKITESYSEEAHRLLANPDCGLAPTLRCHVVLEDEIHVVVMDWIDDPEHSDCNSELSKLSPSAFEDIKKAIELLHQENLVFGDLRRPNILLRDGGKRAALVDFDWAGRVKQAQYPEDPNPDIRWHKGVTPHGYIEMAHDDFMLEQLRN